MPEPVSVNLDVAGPPHFNHHAGKGEAMTDSNLHAGLNFLTVCKCAEADITMLLAYIHDNNVLMDEIDEDAANETLADLQSVINTLS